MKKEFCRYAVYDTVTDIRLVCGERYKVNQGLEYVESFRGLCTKFCKVSAFYRKSVVKGREVYIVYWFGTPRRVPFRFVTEAGQVLGLR